VDTRSGDDTAALQALFSVHDLALHGALQAFADSALVWVSFVTQSYVAFARNFVRGVATAESDAALLAPLACAPFALVFACDCDATYTAVKAFWPHVCVVLPRPLSLDTPAGPHIAVHGSVEFKNVVFQKRDAGLAALRVGAALRIGAVAMLDMDVAFLRDPTARVLACMAADPDALAFAQCDERDAVCTSPASCPSPCAGILVLRTTAAPLFNTILLWTQHDKQRYRGEQDFVTTRLREHGVRCAALPARACMGGFAARVSGPRRKSVLDTTSLLHFNFLCGVDKQAAMQRWGVWARRGHT
jgi:hypothetical protein